MNRRKALKQLGVGSGLVLSTPLLLNFLQSCNHDSNTWTPLFLSKEEGFMLKNIADVILPKTDTPSASEVNVPQFIDKYFLEVLEKEEQQRTKTAFDNLLAKVKSDYNSNIKKVTKEDYENLLDSHMKLESTPQPKDEPISISNILNNIKWMTINAYKNTEYIGENVLAYDPVPGSQLGCIPLNEATKGKAWSLK